MLTTEEILDIKEMINSFSFEDLIKIDLRAAVLLITENQYVLSYTKNYGLGYHRNRLYKIYKYIYGDENNFKNYNSLIKANIIFDEGHLIFYFYDLNNLNKNNYNYFINFYNDNKDILNSISKKCFLEISFFNKYNNEYINSDTFEDLINYFNTHTINNTNNKLKKR